jgi:hypothetical protein
LAAFGLTILLAASAQAGLYAALLLAVVAAITIFWPLPSIWLKYPLTSGVLLVVAIIAVFIGLQAISTEGEVARTAVEVAKEARWQELSKTDPKTYLTELQAAGDKRWENELQRLDKSSYIKLVAEREAKEMEDRKKEISELTRELTANASADLFVLHRIYYRLSYLDPTNDEYKKKREILSKQIDARAEKQSLEQSQTKTPEKHVTIENFSWSKGGFDTVMIANFTIKNALPWTVKDVEIRCRHSAPSGTIIDQNTRTIFDKFPANQTKRLTNISMGYIHSQASRSNCEVIGVVSLR